MLAKSRSDRLLDKASRTQLKEASHIPARRRNRRPAELEAHDLLILEDLRKAR